MPDFTAVRSETIAFILGFLSATLFWWILSRIRPLLPRVQSNLTTLRKNIRRKTLDRADAAFRQEVLRRSQTLHLAAPLFPLDEILINPTLMVAPSALLNLSAPATDTILDQAIPYLPDWPILTAQFPLPVLSPSRALENNARIVIIGQPGSGKTTALAHFATQLARNDPAADSLMGSLPVLLHVLDLSLESAATDPLDVIIRAAQSLSPRLFQPRIPRTLRFMTDSGQAVLLLDGLDELSPQVLPPYIAFLADLSEKYPALKMMVTGAPEHLDGLLKAGFQPLAVRAWSAQQSTEFILRWSKSWTSQVAPRILKETGVPSPVDERILSNWLLSDPGFLTPLEWTLKIWGLYAGDLRGSDSKSALEAHLRRLTQDRVPLTAMSALACAVVSQNQLAKRYDHFETTLSTAALIGAASQAEPTSTEKKPLKTRKVSARSGILPALLDCGILVEHSGEQLRFAHPAYVGMLAALSPDPAFVTALPVEPYWCIVDETCRYLAAQNQASGFLRRLLSTDDDPIYSGLLRAARWIKDAPIGTEWRAGVLRRLVSLSQKDNLPVSLRARFLTAILGGNDPSTPLLLKQFLASASSVQRQLAALAIGATGSDKHIDDLTALIGDPAPEVRYAALAAISAGSTQRAAEIVNTILISGEEWLQLAAAELLAHKPPLGYDTLRAALATDQLLARRAAVAGLAQIREPWTKELLEKVAVEDAQWVVRSAAAQVLEQNRTSGNPHVPAPLPKPVDAPWLISFASKQGMGIPPDKPPTELLLQALVNGTQPEKLGALTYLRNQPDDSVIAIIYAQMTEHSGAIREAAFYSLWHIASGGVKLPPPATRGSY